MFPYHYIPSFEGGHFTQHLYWSWGIHYLGAIEYLLVLLGDESFESLVDVGCGDGRFLREVSKRFSDVTLMGFDHSQRAINLARALNPQLDFHRIDIAEF